jgi:hypothetical protein
VRSEKSFRDEKQSETMSFVTLSVLLVAALQMTLSAASDADDIAIEELDMATENVIDEVLGEDVAANAASFPQPDPIDWDVEPEGPPVEFEVLVREREREESCKKKKKKKKNAPDVILSFRTNRQTV